MFVFHFALMQNEKQKIKTIPLCPTRYGLESQNEHLIFCSILVCNKQESKCYK